MSSGDGRPVLMPILGVGVHRYPQRGACLMELAAVLDGRMWTDHPGCTGPLLARLTRGVNDLSTVEGRAGLDPLAPWLVSPRAGPMSLSGDVAVLQALTATAPRSADPKTAARTVRVIPAPRQASRWQRLCWRRAATRLVLAHLRAVATAPAGPDRDAMLRDWFLAAVNAQRTVEGREPLTDDACAWPLRPCSVPVRVRHFAVDEMNEVRVTADLDQWPDSLRVPWKQRRDELAAGTYESAGSASSGW